MSDPCLMTAGALVRGQREGRFSAVELLQAHLARVERLNPALNAVVVMQTDVAMQRAEQADAALARGQHWGPLHGLPMTVKEAIDVAGLPTTWGFEAHRHNIAASHAVTVQHLLDAGAVIYGKTNVPVALADWQSFNPVYGTSRNPWDLDRSPGGSSGGSAAALAAGLSALELGSDIGSSIRNPAHYCGVWGHKPTWGVVPMAGHELPGDVEPDATDIGVVGPLARSAADLQTAMQVLVPQPSIHHPLGRLPVNWRDAGRPVREMRIAVMADDPRAPVDAPVRRAIEDLAGFLRREGLQVDLQARPVDSEAAWRAYVPLLRGALCDHLDDQAFALAQERSAQVGGPATEFPAVHWRGQAQSHRDWLHWDVERRRQRAQWAQFFERFDLLISPIAATAAMRHDQVGMRWERMIPVNGEPQAQTVQLFWAGYSGLAGLPSTAVPVGQTPEGLPIGAQVIGPVLGDPVCLRFAAWLEQAWRGFVAPPMATA